MAQNGLERRVERLERHEPTAATFRDALDAALLQKILARADRLQGRPARPVDHPAPVDRCIRAALAASDHLEGRDRLIRFWDVFVVEARGWIEEQGR
jgi:hypothetical protein